ncbi:hypothetical protein MRX96_038112 [Rhipicephalus microplus]
MATTEMVMFGFDSELDWLPTSFVNRFADEKLFKPTTWSTEELERLGVRCWNARYCCEDEGSVSEMLLHLKRMRRYHAIRCRRCHAAVLHRQIVRHLDSDCEGYRIAGEQSVRHDVADCFRNASAPERHLASDEIGAKQAVSKAMFDPGVVRNTSAASNDNVGDYTPVKLASRPFLR